jgi:hypothetical protein
MILNYKKLTFLIFFLFMGVNSLLAHVLAEAKNTPAVLNCPPLEEPLDAVEFYMEGETRGLRLSGENMEIVSACIETDTFEGWDYMKIIDKDYSFDLCPEKEKSKVKIKKNEHCVLIKYSEIGELDASQKLIKHAKPIEKTLELRLKKLKDDKWEIKGLLGVPPMLHKSGLVTFLRQRANEDLENEWMSNVANKIEVW